MMYTICKRFTFDAAHSLDGLADGHKCGRKHGHTYSVEVELSSASLSPEGMVVDFGVLFELKGYIDGELDHTDLNDSLGFQTTSENIARHMYGWCLARWPETVAVRVSETPSTWAEWRPHG